MVLLQGPHPKAGEEEPRNEEEMLMNPGSMFPQPRDRLAKAPIAEGPEIGISVVVGAAAPIWEVHIPAPHLRQTTATITILTVTNKTEAISMMTTVVIEVAVEEIGVEDANTTSQTVEVALVDTISTIGEKGSHTSSSSNSSSNPLQMHP